MRPSAASAASEVNTSWRTSSAREIGADQVQHGGDAAAAEHRQPVGFGRLQPAVTVAADDRLGDRDQLLGRIPPLGRLRRSAAQGFQVPMVHRARQHVDLGAVIVDVILARDRETHLGEQARERVAEYRAAPVPDVQRPGRIGRAVLDVDPPAAAQIHRPVIAPGRERDLDLRAPEIVAQAQVDEAGRRYRHLLDVGGRAQPGGKQLGQLQRRAPRRFRQHQRGVGRGIAVRRITRRLDGDALEVERLGQLARVLAGRDRLQDVRAHLLERVHRALPVSLNSRSCSSSANRSVMPAM